MTFVLYATAVLFPFSYFFLARQYLASVVLVVLIGVLLGLYAAETPPTALWWFAGDRAAPPLVLAAIVWITGSVSATTHLTRRRCK